MERALEKGISQIIPTNLWGELYAYSGYRQNDLGDMQACLDLDGGEYALVVSYEGLFGFCVPSVCSRDDIAKVLIPLVPTL